MSQKRMVLHKTQPKAISALKRPPMLNVKKSPSAFLDVPSENIPRSPEFEFNHNKQVVSLHPFTKEKKTDTACSTSYNTEMKMPSPKELHAQRKMKIAHYGRKKGYSKSIPEEPLLAPVANAKKRCGWITSQSDPVHIAYHDQEWGVPVHDDKLLFELLTLASAQSEISWSAILGKREKYRAAFDGFDPVIVSTYASSRIFQIRESIDILQQDGKVESVVENARNVLKISEEFGSFDTYLWRFFNNKPIVTSFRMSSQVPVKSSRSELISKDLIKRGFRGVAPAIIYSFMQAAGMTNDHTVQCFRRKECVQTEAVCGRFGGQELYAHKQLYVF